MISTELVRKRVGLLRESGGEEASTAERKCCRKYSKNWRKSCCDLLKEKRKAPKIGGSRQRSGGEGAVSSTKMGEADVLMPEKVVESLLGGNGDLIQVVVVIMLILAGGCGNGHN